MSYAVPRGTRAATGLRSTITLPLYCCPMRGGQLIREARRRAQLTQAELAQRTGTTQSAVARWETNRVSPTLETLTEVVGACGLDLVVHLEPHDDHDWTLVEAKQQLAPHQRLEDLESMVDLVNEGRAALRNG